MTVTFPVEDVELAINPLEEKSTGEILKRLIGKHLQAHARTHKTLVEVASHPFVMAAHYAYNDHRPLILSPDHVWLVLCQGFAHHLHVNAENLRSLLVSHQGKKELHVYRDDLIRGNPDTDWQTMFSDFSTQVREQIGEELHDLLTPTFSTTTPIEKAAYEITLMDAMSPYFEYFGSLCGIPSITLEGTPDDWRMMLMQVRKFRRYDLDWWVDKLEPILEQFVRASEGRKNKRFWRKLYKLENSSGGPYITGWIVKLFPYIGEDSNLRRNPYIEREPKKGEWMEGLKMRDFPTALSRAIVHCDDRRQKWDVAFVAGFVGLSQHDLALRPEIAWAVRDETAAEMARQIKRQTNRDWKSGYQFVYVENKLYTVEVKDGAFYLNQNANSLWGQDGEANKWALAEHPADGKWTEVDYKQLLYRYNAAILPETLALKIVTAHEAKMASYEDSQN